LPVLTAVRRKPIIGNSGTDVQPILPIGERVVVGGEWRVVSGGSSGWWLAVSGELCHRLLASSAEQT
jgi:hypothetical protein